MSHDHDYFDDNEQILAKKRLKADLKKAVCRIFLVYHENVVTISCFRTFLIFS